jgi:DNA-binding FadR family transcriptional regulator
MTGESPTRRALFELRRRLDGGEYEGSRLPPERELASMLKVGRRAVREALGALEQEGLISRHQGRGTFIAPQPFISGQQTDRLAHRVNPLEVIEARLSIEPMLARRSAVRASRADIDAMRRTVDLAAAAKNVRDYEAFDAAFHRKIADCAGNALFLAMFEMIISVREKADWERVRDNYFAHGGAERSFVEHSLVLEAIIQRDPTAAEVAMRDHLDKVAASFLGGDGRIASFTLGPPL